MLRRLLPDRIRSSVECASQPREHSLHRLCREVFVRRRQRASIPSLADGAQEPRQQVIDDRRGAHSKSGALQLRLEPARVEPVHRQHGVPENSVGRAGLVAPSPRTIEQQLQRDTVEASDLPDRMTGSSGALKERQAFQIVRGIEALATRRPNRTHGAIPAFPGAQDVRPEAGTPHDGTNGIPRSFAFELAHARTLLSRPHIVNLCPPSEPGRRS